MPSPQQKRKTSAEVQDNEHEEENTEYYISSNNENFDNQCSSQDIPKSNGDQLVDGLIDFLANSDCSGVPYEKMGDFNITSSSVKWSVLAQLKSQPHGQNFQAQI